VPQKYALLYGEVLVIVAVCYLRLLFLVYCVVDRKDILSDELVVAVDYCADLGKFA